MPARLRVRHLALATQETVGLCLVPYSFAAQPVVTRVKPAAHVFGVSKSVQVAAPSMHCAQTASVAFPLLGQESQPPSAGLLPVTGGV